MFARIGDLGLPAAGLTRIELSAPRALVTVVAQLSLAGAVLLHLNRTLAGDVYFLLASGRHLVEEGFVARNPFPTLAEGRVWNNQQWLAEWLFFRVHGLGGMALVSVGYALVLAAALVPLARACTGRARVAVAAAWALSLVCTVAVLDPRAGGFAVLLFAGVIGALEAARRRRWWLLALPPLFVVWANVHGSFPAGLLLVALFGLAAAVRVGGVRRPAIEAYRAGLYVVALGACLAALLATPPGLGVFDYLRAIDAHISPSRLPFEWQYTFLHPAVLGLVVAFAALAVWLWRRAPRPRPLEPMLVAAGFVVLALTAVRQVVWLGPLAFYLVLTLAPARPQRRTGSLAAPLAALGLALMAGWWAFVGPAPPGPPQAAAATRHALAHPPPRGRLVLPAGAGSYSLWRDPDRPIAIDGRLELYTARQVISTYRLLNGEGALRYVRRWRIGGMVTRNARGVRVLRRHGFRVAAHKRGAWYLVRRAGARQR